MQKKIKKEICQRWREIDKISKELCHDNCRWYHGSWCILKCLDLVTGPFLFEKFYQQITHLKLNKIAVVGTAGISMPYFISLLQPKVELDIIDICPTPLKACETYAKENGLKWNMIQRDMMKEFESNTKYDLVVNDAFLNLFSNSNKVVMLQNIYKLLNIDGYYITTLRKGLYQDEIQKASIGEQDKFVNRAVSCSKEMSLQERKLIQKKAEAYSSFKTNYPMHTIESVKELFENNGFEIISIDENEVFGENEYTFYFEVVARKREKD